MNSFPNVHSFYYSGSGSASTSEISSECLISFEGDRNIGLSLTRSSSHNQLSIAASTSGASSSSQAGSTSSTHSLHRNLLNLSGKSSTSDGVSQSCRLFSTSIADGWQSNICVASGYSGDSYSRPNPSGPYFLICHVVLPLWSKTKALWPPCH